jgi:hypothetical protein
MDATLRPPDGDLDGALADRPERGEPEETHTEPDQRTSDSEEEK